ncbi:6-phosphogluconolactonase [Qipengyuania nanhaisediminis]
MRPGADDAAIADWIAIRIARALETTDGTVPIALPGGSTPFPICEILVTRDLDWSRVVIEPTDDRVVSEDHPASNAGKLRALFEPVGARLASLVEMEASGQLPSGGYRLVWLGMGTDGHIASLFPNTDPRVDDERWLRRITPDPLPPEAPFDRVTLTLPALLSTDELLFVIRGEDKSALFEAALRGENDLPVARLLAARDIGHHRPVTCFT